MSPDKGLDKDSLTKNNRFTQVRLTHTGGGGREGAWRARTAAGGLGAAMPCCRSH
jgi:hypothetical protein